MYGVVSGPNHSVGLNLAVMATGMEDDATERGKLADIAVNVGLVLKATDLDAARDFLEGLRELLTEQPRVRVIYRNVSADHLWIKRGDP